MVASMSDISSWGEYIKKYSHGDSQGVIADKMGVDTSTVGRWLKGSTGQPAADKAINFARHYNRSPVEALIHAGYINPDEVGQAVEIAGSMRDVSDAALTGELVSRLSELRRFQVGSDDSQGGLVSDDWGEDPGVGRMQNGN
jgi:transcriptional regulator with XRE-family HTH domain